VLNKSDLVKENNVLNARQYLDTIFPKKLQIIQAVNGKVPLDSLLLQTVHSTEHYSQQHIDHSYHANSEKINFNGCVIESFCSETSEHLSFGYIFPPAIIFNRKKVTTFIESRTAGEINRLKAVIHCGKFWYAFNSNGSQFETYESFYRRDSRIEFITEVKQINRELIKSQLLSCIINTD